MLPPPVPRDDIGAFYKLLAGFMAIIAAVLMVLREVHGRASTWIDVGEIGVIAVLILALIRPEGLDQLVKTIADKLPFLRFSKD